jgi:hypothetical protein
MASRCLFDADRPISSPGVSTVCCEGRRTTTGPNASLQPHGNQRSLVPAQSRSRGSDWQRESWMAVPDRLSSSLTCQASVLRWRGLRRHDVVRRRFYSTAGADICRAGVVQPPCPGVRDNPSGVSVEFRACGGINRR